jgi:hypothetical protein
MTEYASPRERLKKSEAPYETKTTYGNLMVGQSFMFEVGNLEYMRVEQGYRPIGCWGAATRNCADHIPVLVEAPKNSKSFENTPPKEENVKNTENKVSESSEKDLSASGATRNREGMYRYDLLRSSFLDTMAAVMAEGAKSHGERNWELGFEDLDRDVLNHIHNHWRRFRQGDRSEPHLAKMAIGLMFLDFFAEKGVLPGSCEPEKRQEQEDLEEHF